jgi:hypothetical protein
MAASTTQLVADDSALRRAKALAELHAIQSMCRGLHRLPPEGGPWRGAASAAYRLRVAGLRERVDAACAALSAAEASL